MYHVREKLIVDGSVFIVDNIFLCKKTLKIINPHLTTESANDIMVVDINDFLFTQGISIKLPSTTLLKKQISFEDNTNEILQLLNMF